MFHIAVLLLSLLVGCVLMSMAFAACPLALVEFVHRCSRSLHGQMLRGALIISFADCRLQSFLWLADALPRRFACSNRPTTVFTRAAVTTCRRYLKCFWIYTACTYPVLRRAYKLRLIMSGSVLDLPEDTIQQIIDVALKVRSYRPHTH